MRVPAPRFADLEEPPGRDCDAVHATFLSDADDLLMESHEGAPGKGWWPSGRGLTISGVAIVGLAAFTAWLGPSRLGRSGRAFPTDLLTVGFSADDWDAVDGGMNRECRGTDSSDKDVSYYTVYPFTSLSYCKKLCLNDRKCKAVSYGADFGDCQLWHVPVDASKGSEGWMCFKFSGKRTGNEEAPPPPSFATIGGGGGIGKVCRAGNGVKDSEVCSFSTQSKAGCDVHMLVSLGSCQELCVNEPACTGIEYSGSEQRCEVWKVKMGQPADADGFLCLARKGGDASAEEEEEEEEEEAPDADDEDDQPEAGAEMEALGVGVNKSCSGHLESCLDTRCCEEKGDSCYQKNEFWASCRSTCQKGEVDQDGVDALPWSCKRLGAPPSEGSSEASSVSETIEKASGSSEDAGCSSQGEDCQNTQCCADPGFQCYRKNEGWASCRAMCKAGEYDPIGPDEEPWSCERIGTRSSLKLSHSVSDDPRAAVEELFHRSRLASNCSSEGEDCRDSKCCRDEGFTCYEKTKYWASCRPSCKPGEVDRKGPDKLPWSCKALGRRTRKAPTKGVARTPNCSDRGDSCARTRCCSDATLSCYQKNDTYSGCRDTCQAGLYDPDGYDWLPWTCKEQSPEAPGATTTMMSTTTLTTQTISATSFTGAQGEFARAITDIERFIGGLAPGPAMAEQANSDPTGFAGVPNADGYITEA